MIAQFCFCVGRRTLEFEVFNERTFRPGFDPEHELSVKESHSTIVEEQRLYTVAKWIAHAGRYKNVFEPIGVEIRHTDPPGPVSFQIHSLGDLLPGSLAGVPE